MEERMPVQGPPHRVAPAPQWHAGTRQPLEVQDAGPMDSTRPGALQALQTTEPTLFQPCQPQSPLWLPPAPCGNGHRRIPASWVTMVVHVPRCHQHPWETATLESTWSPHCSRDLVEGTCEARCGTAMLLSCHSVTRLARLVTLMTWTTRRGAHLGPARGPWFLFIASSLSKHLKTITTL